MTFKQILTLVCLLASGFLGSVRADQAEENIVGSYISIAKGIGIDSSDVCSQYCSTHHTDGECTDYGQFGKYWDPATQNAIDG